MTETIRAPAGITETIRARVLILQAGAPVRRDAVLELSGAMVAGVRPAHDDDRGPLYDVVLPGLIDAHSHARGLPLACQGVTGGPLERFLLELGALTPLDPRDEALVAADAALTGGITAVQVIHHSFATAPVYAEQARAIAGGYATTGIRAGIALALTDEDEYGPPTGLAGTAAGATQIPGTAIAAAPEPHRGVSPDDFAALADGLLDTTGLAQIDAVGPVAPQWCSASALRAIAGSTARRVHAHMLESHLQRLAATSADPLQRLDDAGLLGPRSSFAHGVWLDDDQIRRVARAGAVIVHCPGSNQRLGAGHCRVRQLLDHGVPVALGIDSHGAGEEPDMFAEMREALRIAEELDAPLTPAEALGMATTGGSRALCRSDLGALHPGAAADVIALTLPHAVAAADPAEWVVLQAGRGDVVARWIAGQSKEPDGAVDAGRRLRAVIESDGTARVARMVEAAGTWRRVQGAWRDFESRNRTTR